MQKPIIANEVTAHMQKNMAAFVVANIILSYVISLLPLNDIPNIRTAIASIDKLLPSMRFMSQIAGNELNNRLYIMIAWPVGFIFLFLKWRRLNKQHQLSATRAQLAKYILASTAGLALIIGAFFFAINENIQYSGRERLVVLILSLGPVGYGAFTGAFVLLFNILLTILYVSSKNITKKGKEK